MPICPIPISDIIIGLTLLFARICSTWASDTGRRISVVPGAFKSAYICPLLKKPDSDSADVKNSNLTVISKLLEKLVA